MNCKRLILTLLIFTLPAKTASQTPSIEWNTTNLGVSYGEIFEFKLTKFNDYYANDTIIHHEINLNKTSIDRESEYTDDEILTVGETFSLTIQDRSIDQNPFFQSIWINDTRHELKIPYFDVIFKHNSYNDNRIFEPIFRINSPNIVSNRFAALFLIPDWEMYKLLYSTVDNENTTIVDENDFYITKYTRNFQIRESTVIFDQTLFENISNSIKPWHSRYANTSIHATIERGSGLVEKVEWRSHTHDRGIDSPRLEILIENIDENSNDPFLQSLDLKLNNYVVVLILIIAIIIMVVGYKLNT